MQIANDLRTQIEAAFGSVDIPAPEALLLDGYRGSEDALELQAAFAGKHWRALGLKELFYHREMVIALSGLGYQAYLPAYLIAALEKNEPYGDDLREYLLNGLRPLSDQPRHIAETRARLSALDPAQKAAVAAVLGHLAERWNLAEAEDILKSWNS